MGPTLMWPVRAPRTDVAISDTATAAAIAHFSTWYGTKRVMRSGIAAPMRPKCDRQSTVAATGEG